MPAPPGKDAGPKVALWAIEVRGRSLAVIGARRFACNVCEAHQPSMTGPAAGIDSDTFVPALP
jgi:hypothetical protein